MKIETFIKIKANIAFYLESGHQESINDFRNELNQASSLESIETIMEGFKAGINQQAVSDSENAKRTVVASALGGVLGAGFFGPTLPVAKTMAEFISPYATGAALGAGVGGIMSLHEPQEDKQRKRELDKLFLDELETLPLYHPESQIVYAASRSQVTDVWVAGKQLMKNRQLLTLDETQLKEKARYWAKKIKGMS